MVLCDFECMDMPEVIEHLCSRGDRGSTTPNEHWAANEIEKLMRNKDLIIENQTFKGNKTFGERLVIHLLPSFLVSLIPLYSEELAPLSSLFLGFFIFSFIVEVHWFKDIASRVFLKKLSMNILARQSKPEAERRILIVAHYDSQKKGNIFNPRFVDFMTRFSSTTSTITPLHLTFLSIVGLLFTTTTFLVHPTGNDATIHLILHVLFLIWTGFSLILVTEWTLGKTYVPGANDNATGVAVMVDMSASMTKSDWGVSKSDMDSIEFWFLASGCEETGLGGAMNFIRMNRTELKSKPLQVICLDGLGYGNIHYFTADGILKTRPYDKNMIHVADKLMRERYGEDRSFVCRVFTDGLAFTLNGFPALTFGSLDHEKLIKNYHWHSDTPENVDVEALLEARDFILEYARKLIVTG